MDDHVGRPDSHLHTPHPLVELLFESDRSGAPLTRRHWYHVPRVGDEIELDPDSSERVTGTVHQVIWGDDGTVLIRLGP